MIMEPTRIFLLVLLLFAPLLSPFISVLYSRLTQEVIPPWLPQINSFTFIQAVVALSLILVVNRSGSPVVAVINLGLVILLFFLIPMQAANYNEEKQVTQKHVEKIIRDQSKIKWKSNINLDFMVEIANTLVDVDFFPNSLTNKLSKPVHEQKREQLVRLIKFLSDNEPNLKQQDFLVLPPERQRLNRDYIVITTVSTICYIISIVLSIGFYT